VAGLGLAPDASALAQVPPVMVGGRYTGSGLFVNHTCDPTGPTFTQEFIGELVDQSPGNFTGYFRKFEDPTIRQWHIFDIIGTVTSSGTLQGTAKAKLVDFSPDFFYPATFTGSLDGAALRLVVVAPDVFIGTQKYCGVTITLTMSASGGDCVIDPSVGVFSQFDSLGGIRRFPVKTSTPDCRWAVGVDPQAPWLSVSPTSGTGDGEIVVTVAELPRTDVDRCRSRTAYITVRTQRSQPIITIYQASIYSSDCGCPAGSAGKLNSGGAASLHAARRFRDEVLARTARGAEYTRLYYAHAGEITSILEANPWLLVRAARLLDRHTPAIQSIVDHGRAPFSDADLDEVDALVAAVAASGSPALRRAAARVRLDMRSEAVRTELGVDVRPGIPSNAKRLLAEDPLFTAFAGLGALDASEVLAVAARGRAWARASEEHAAELLGILAADPRLALRAPGAFGRLTSALESVVRTGGASLDAEACAELDAFLSAVEPAAGPGLQSAVSSLRRDLRAPRALEGFGVRTPAAAPRPAAPRVAGPSTLDFSTYFGGSGDETSTQVALDAAGNIYLTGSTSAAGFATAGSAQTAYGGGESDAYVVKLDPTASTVLFATLLGGSGQDIATGIAVDPSGAVYVSGTTTSPNFPVAGPAIRRALGGSRDGFLAKLAPDGSALTLSTYLGGSGEDTATGVAVSGKNVYVTGITSSADFPAVKGLRRTLQGSTDAFVMKLKKGGAKIAYSTFFGGAGLEYAAGVAVDAAGNAYVAGVTSSSDLPTTRPAQPALGGLFDGFVAKLNAKGSAVVYATYLGGSEVDGVTGIAVDAGGNAYVTGTTASTNFPVASALQSSYGGGLLDAFVAKLGPDGTSFAYSTYLGGADEDRAARIAVDSAGRAYLTGLTVSANFPTRNPVQPQLDGDAHDAFVSVVEASGASLASSTFLGGAGDDVGVSVAVGGSGTATIVGETVSTDFPLVGPLQETNGGRGDLFVVRFTPE
jgi:hypothetical protein